MKTIVMTGGGTAGHVTANLALIPHLLEEGWDIHYIGSRTGIERTLLATFPNIPYHAISCGKLRRYKDIQNFIDPFRVLRGMWQSFWLLRKIRPALVFSKGGFVSVPVAVGGWLNRVPVLLHESDLSLGLANRICSRFAVAILTTFPETAQHVQNGIQTGTPLRAALFAGQREKGLALCGFSGEKPVLLVTGGSSGAVAVNDAVRAALPALLETYQVAHLCGAGNVDQSLTDTPGYKQFAYLEEELADIFAMADVLVSRAGSTTISEILALRKPALLIPYPSSSSRGDQIENARNLEKRGLAMALMQDQLTPESLVQHLGELWAHRAEYVIQMESITDADGTIPVLEQIRKYAKA